jgi:CRP/FNR family transcriptional regulator, anaerobic regulatory protein
MKSKAICIDPSWSKRTDCSRCAIRNRVLFADLPVEGLNDTLLHIDDLVFAEDSMLYRIGEHEHVIYTVRRGLLKLVRYLPDGTERIVRLLKAGDVAAIETLTGSPFKHTAITLNEVEVCRIPVSSIERLDLHAPHLAQQLMLRWQGAIDDADRSLVEFSTGTAEARIAHLLLYLSSLNDDGTGFELNRHDMGSLLSITTETASRVMANLKRRGLVMELPGGKAFRCDRESLARIADPR